MRPRAPPPVLHILHARAPASLLKRIFSVHFSESFVHRFARRPAFVSSEMFPVLLPLSLVLGWDPNRRAGKRSFYNAALVCVYGVSSLLPRA